MTILATAVVDDVELRVDFDTPHCIAIGLRFDGDQPNAFGLPRATAAPFSVGAFVGDTRAGGSVNCEVVTMAPHGNGTHTECVGHVVDERVDVHGLVDPALLTAALITVPLTRFGDTEESYVVPVDSTELVLTSASLSAALLECPSAQETDALIIRTSPCSGPRRIANWSAGHPAFPTSDAMVVLASGPWCHLLLDLPSVDRAEDGGQLDNHRKWWGLSPGAKSAGPTPTHRTITEMIDVGDEISDGLYALSLQIAPFVLDAAPSRPILFPLIARP